MTRETTTLTITYTEADDELYQRYQTQTQCQRVDLTLDLREGRLYAAPWGNIGGGQSMAQFNGVDVEWAIPPLRKAAFAQLVNAIREDCQTILDHSEVYHDGSNLVGRPDEEGQAAYERIANTIETWGWETHELWEPWEASSYFEQDPCSDYGITAESTDEEIASAAEEAVSDAAPDHILDTDDVERHFMRLRDELE